MSRRSPRFAIKSGDDQTDATEMSQRSARRATNSSEDQVDTTEMARRSARLATKSGEEQADATAALGTTYVPLVKADTSTDDDIVRPTHHTGPFRLQDLAAELRTHIYGYALNEPFPRDLSSFTLPALTLTSRLVRDESLPILFAECPFRLLVGCNAFTDYTTDKERDYRLAGVTGIKRTVSSDLKTAGNAGLFRDITLEIYDASFIYDVREWNRNGRQDRTWAHPFGRNDDDLQEATLNLRVVETNLSLSVVEKPARHRNVNDKAKKALDGALEKASSIARKFADEKAFKGFKIEHLKAIAKAFRLETFLRGIPNSTVGFERDICGTIDIKHILNNFFKNVGDAALFRNVSFEVFDSFDIKEAREWERQGRPNPFRGQSYGDLIAVTLRLEVVAGCLQVAIVNGRRHPALGQRPYSGRVGEAMIVRDVDGSVDKAVEIAQGFADEEDFKGFKISDLHKIATAFRLE
ncbi:hypothetical protein PRZ48_004556 [Zasmidium cellare]|uniref:Uncharacterized protein n=1 Tax=Zasmidium cellare TaxID=395010 RepID=A0ABR0EPW2_ZASCE|nr:hypothetical protein PRZ48_004556 [Zasmidium cellare]